MENNEIYLITHRTLDGIEIIGYVASEEEAKQICKMRNHKKWNKIDLTAYRKVKKYEGMIN